MRNACAALVLTTAFAAAAQSSDFPAGTQKFFETNIGEAIPAQGGGIWATAPAGIVRYTASGAGAPIVIAGGVPQYLVAAADGTLWVANAAGIVRITTVGAVLEQYALTNVHALAVATDGALWYLRASGINTIGRIAGGSPTERPSPPDAWNLAAAPAGAIWILPTGFATGNDNLYQMTPAGALTTIPLGEDVLFGKLQALPDGTLYVGTGVNDGVLRIRPDATAVEVLVRNGPGSSGYLADVAGNLWLGDYALLAYRGATGSPFLFYEMPRDPRSCLAIPSYFYRPLAIDSDGTLWVAVDIDFFGITTPPPCNEPLPPPMPDLVRLNPAQLVPLLVPPAPALSPVMLAALALALAAIAAAMTRG